MTCSFVFVPCVSSSSFFFSSLVLPFAVHGRSRGALKVDVCVPVPRLKENVIPCCTFEMERLSFASHLGSCAYKRLRASIFDSSLDNFVGVSLNSVSGRLTKLKLWHIQVVIVALETLMVTNQYKYNQELPEGLRVSVVRDTFGNIRFVVREGRRRARREGGGGHGEEEEEKEDETDRTRGFYYPSVLALVEDVCRTLN